MISAVRRDSVVDHLSRLTALLGVSMPVFWLGLLLQLCSTSARPRARPWGRLSKRIRTNPVQNVTGFLMVDTALTGNWVAFQDALVHLILPTSRWRCPRWR